MSSTMSERRRRTERRQHRLELRRASKMSRLPCIEQHRAADLGQWCASRRFLRPARWVQRIPRQHGCRAANSPRPLAATCVAIRPPIDSLCAADEQRRGLPSSCCCAALDHRRIARCQRRPPDRERAAALWFGINETAGDGVDAIAPPERSRMRQRTGCAARRPRRARVTSAASIRGSAAE